MNRRRYGISLGMALAASGWAACSFAVAEATPELQSAPIEAPPRDRPVGLGYHPGNYVGPIAFDVIVRPLPHLAVDVQVGGLRLDNGVRGLQVAPELQWEFRRGWRSTPYAGLGFRYEEAWSDGMTATSKGGFLVAGWQFRWRSGFAVLLGGGVLYMTPISLNSPTAGYGSSGGWSGTYEVGARYFF
jgi:hypothetical protein